MTTKKPTPKTMSPNYQNYYLKIVKNGVVLLCGLKYWVLFKKQKKNKKQFNKSINETVKFCQQITNFVTLLHGLFKDDLTDG